MYEDLAGVCIDSFNLGVSILAKVNSRDANLDYWF